MTDYTSPGDPVYRYNEERPKIFTEDGLATFIRIRDAARKQGNAAGAFSLGSVIRGATGDSWVMIACVDLLVEREEIREITKPDSVAGQDRIFVLCGAW